MREIKNIVIHCSDTKPEMDIGFKEIDEWHKARGFKSASGIHCGYHFIVRINGDVEDGRPIEEVGAHVQNHNHSSIGICMVGNGSFHDAQFKALKTLVESLRLKFQEAEVRPHCFFDTAIAQGKTCPNFNIYELFPLKGESRV